jgi:legumain
MYAKGMYAEMVFYLETCESGSMFEDLKTNTGIYALSASNPSESSWGSYCPPDDKVNGVSVGSCLGDLFSVNWMEDTETGDLARSLNTHFEVIRKKTNLSQVMQWGDLSFKDEPISHFLSGRESVTLSFLSKLKSQVSKAFEFTTSDASTSTRWDSRDNKLLYLINKFTNSQSQEDLNELNLEYHSRKYFD